MPVIINLKETFSTDSQSTLTDKVNFNFNQLLALGIGQPGPIGPIGLTGPVGPVGPDGPIGPRGSYIFSESTTIGAGPVSNPLGTGMIVGDIYITSDTIWQLESTNPVTWTNVANFGGLATSAGAGVFRLISPNSRIVKPAVTNGSDLTNSSTDSDPNYATPGAGKTYQTVLYNFNEQATFSVKLSGGNIQILSNTGTVNQFLPTSTDVNLATDTIHVPSHGYSTGDQIVYSAEGGTPIGGLSNNAQYYVDVVDPDYIKLYQSDPGTPVDLTSYGTAGPLSSLHKLISPIPDPDSIFPATANLSIYSIFDPSATSAEEFQSDPDLRGYRHQFELGSIDSIQTSYPSGTPSGYDYTGGYLISPSFENLRVKKYRIANGSWTNDYPGSYYLRTEYDLSSTGSEDPDTFAPRRHSEQIWKINKAGQSQGKGCTVQLRLTNSEILKTNEASSGVEVDGIYLKRGTNDDASIPGVSFGIGFDPVNMTLARVEGSPSLIGIEFKDLAVRVSNNSFYGSIAVTSTGDLAITNASPSKIVRLNTAIQVRDDRLAYGLPFPVSQSVIPVLNNPDANTLDEYQELTFTPVIDWGTLPTGTQYSQPVISGATGKMTKIGNQVTLNIKFVITGPGITTSLSSAPPYYEDPLSVYTTAIEIAGGSLTRHALGNEAYPLIIKNVPDHWPDKTNGGDGMKFNVAIKNIVSDLLPTLRNWDLTYSVSEVPCAKPWLAMNPSSIYAKFGLWSASTTDYSALAFYGYRKNSTILSKLSVVDFLNPSFGAYPPNAVEVSLSGTYLTDHQTAETVYPYLSMTTTTTTTLTPPVCPVPTISSATINDSFQLRVFYAVTDPSGLVNTIKVDYYDDGIESPGYHTITVAPTGSGVPIVINTPYTSITGTIKVRLTCNCSGGPGAATSYSDATVTTTTTTTVVPAGNSIIYNNIGTSTTIIDWNIKLNNATTSAYTRYTYLNWILGLTSENFNWGSSVLNRTVDFYFTTDPATSIATIGLINLSTPTHDYGAGALTCLDPGTNTKYRARWYGVDISNAGLGIGGISIDCGLV